MTTNISSSAATNSAGQSVPVVLPITTIVQGHIPLPGYSVLLVEW